MREIPYEESLEYIHPELAIQWHPTKNGDLFPRNIKDSSDKKVWWKCENGHEWDARVRSRTSLGTNCPYCAGKKVAVGENDFETLHPNIAKEWNYLKNKGLKPSMFPEGSGKIVWWICDKNHEWQTSINHRRQGTNCPYCAGKKVAVGDNDFETRFPDLAKEWNRKRNGSKQPNDYTWCSGEKVWWQCSKKHEWITPISERAGGKGCPYCSGRKAIVGENDLASTNPNLAKEWHPTKNKNLTPFMVKAGSDRKVWWLCESGHEWQASVNNRSAGCNCPYCGRKKAIPHKNSLEVLYPEISEQWNYKKNGELKPDMFLPKSGIKVWWLCKKGHEWQIRIVDRVNGNNCPYCSGRRVITGVNDITITHPQVTKEWNYEKNAKTPNQYSYGSSKKVWWICNEGHEWQGQIAHRTILHNGCPYCSGLRAIKGVNDLKTRYPMIANEWNFKKNNKLNPDEVLPNSTRKVWWVCEYEHEWFTSIRNRSKGYGCPKCRKNTKSTL